MYAGELHCAAIKKGAQPFSLNLGFVGETIESIVFRPYVFLLFLLFQFCVSFVLSETNIMRKHCKSVGADSFRYAGFF